MSIEHKPLATLERVLDTLICYVIDDGNVLVKIKYRRASIPDDLTLGDIVNEIENLLCGHIGKIRILRERARRRKEKP